MGMDVEMREIIHGFLVYRMWYDICTMSMHRAIKKTLYAAGFFAFLGFIAYAVVSPYFERENVELPPDAVQEAYIPITVEGIVVVPHIENPGPKGKTIDVVARIKNQNARAGTASYPVRVIVKGPSGDVISTASQDIYVLPGGVQYFTALDVVIPPDKQFGSVSIETPESVVFTALAERATLPQFGVFLRDRSQFEAGSQRIEQQTGIVTNNSTFDWERVEVTGVALDNDGKIIGVGKTFVGRLIVGEQREFTVQWPYPASQTARVIAIATTNIYSPENAVHIIGDPASLR